MADQLQLRGGTTAETATFTGALREVTVDTDKDTLVVHDNALAGGYPLLRQDLSNLPAGTIDNADINASAAIAGTKISPDFGSQTVTTTGVISSALGAAATPSITFTGDLNTGIYSPGADQLAVSTGGVQRINIEADGDINIDGGGVFYDATNNRLAIGTTSPSALLHTVGGKVRIDGTGGANRPLFEIIPGSAPSDGVDVVASFTGSGSYGPLKFWTGGSQKATLDSSGRLLVGTSTASQASTLLLQGRGSATGSAIARLCTTDATPTNGASLGIVAFSDSGHTTAAQISVVRDGGTWTSGTSQPTRLEFSTTSDSAATPTERMRITNGGSFRINQTTTDDPAGTNTQGLAFGSAGWISNCRDSATPVLIGRKGNDGTLVEFSQDGTYEGNISVSGTTVSYNGAHLSRWSQLPSGAERTEILRGSVLSNIDEMCEWGDEENEQLNRMKVSDVEGDKNVSGVFQAWDDDDDTYTDDFYCAMTGDFIIRIAEGVTVERGDLLMSAGDGTAKPQDDDIIRSKTIAKVTSTNVSCTYDDGSYCVPCVLMAC
jgi:hypothetical protein